MSPAAFAVCFKLERFIVPKFVGVSAAQQRKVCDMSHLAVLAFYGVQPNVIALCQEMRNKTQYHIDKLQKRHFKKHLSKQLGEYPINVFDLAGPFFLPEQPLLEHR